MSRCSIRHTVGFADGVIDATGLGRVLYPPLTADSVGRQGLIASAARREDIIIASRLRGLSTFSARPRISRFTRVKIAQSVEHGFVEPKVESSNLSFHLDKVEPYGPTLKPMPRESLALHGHGTGA